MFDRAYPNLKNNLDERGNGQFAKHAGDGSSESVSMASSGTLVD